MAEREEVLQAVLDKLWSSAYEFGADVNEYGNPSSGAREQWQAYAEQLLLRWLEYHSPSAAERAKKEDGTDVVSITGETKRFVRGTTDDDIRFGALPYGFRRG